MASHEKAGHALGPQPLWTEEPTGGCVEDGLSPDGS